MIIDEQKELELLTKSIEEASKHARNILFALVVSSIYVIISAFSQQPGDELTLPIMQSKVTKEEFFAFSPIVILFIYAYLHIYVRDLRIRIETFRRTGIECKNIDSPEMLLFPWILNFGYYSIYTMESSAPGEDIERKSRARSSIYIRIVAIFTIWALAPLVLLSLWVKFIQEENTVSMVPFACFGFSLFIMTSSFLVRTFANVTIAVICSTLFVITLASIPDYSTALGLTNIWEDFRTSLQSDSGVVSGLLRTGVFTVYMVVFLVLAAIKFTERYLVRRIAIEKASLEQDERLPTREMMERYDILSRRERRIEKTTMYARYIVLAAAMVVIVLSLLI